MSSNMERIRAVWSAQPDTESLENPENFEADDIADDIVVVDRSRFRFLEKILGNLKRPFSRRIALPASALLMTIAVIIFASTREGASPVSARDNLMTPIERFDPNTILDDQVLRILPNNLERNAPEAVGGADETESVEKPCVRAVYLVPADREINPEYAQGVENALLDVQKWYAGELGGGESFQVCRPIVETVRTGHNAQWYSTNAPEGVPVDQQFIINVWSDAADLIPDFFNGDKWVVYIDAIAGPDQKGAVGYLNSSPAILNGIQLHSLSGMFPSGDTQSTVLSSAGVLAHELGHTFGLVHPEPRCYPGPDPEDCNLLMSYSYSYPIVDLTQEEKNMLNASAFFDFQYTEPAPDFQVEVRMYNLKTSAGTPQELFSLNGSRFMRLLYDYYPVNEITIDISKWIEPGANSVGLEAIGLESAFTYGFEIFINGIKVYESSCGESGVTHCNNGPGFNTKVFSEKFTFDAEIPTLTPTPVETSTPAKTPTLTVAPTLNVTNTPNIFPTRRPTNTPTERFAGTRGDVNCDNLTNSLDALLILQRIAGLISNLDCAHNADTNFDGTISAVDALLILQLDAGIIDGFSRP